MKKNKKICVVGAGNWGMNHVRTLNKLDSLGGIVENKLSVIKELKKKFPSCKVFIDIEEALVQNFDGYIVATPASTHFDIAIKIIENNKPLLVEKPMTLDYRSSIKLSNFAKEKGVNLMVGHVLLFHPAFQKMKELINDGLLGSIQYIYSNRLNLGTFRTNENVFWSFAPHDISLFNYFFEQKPLSLNSKGVDILQKNIHDSSITTFEYKNNKMGHIFVSWLHPFKEHRFVIIGSDGMLHFEDSAKNKELIYYDNKAEFINSIPNPKFGETVKIAYKDEEPLKNELKYFIANLDSNKDLISDGRDGSDVIKILEQATNSLNEK